MTDVSDAMFCWEPWALSMRMTVSGVLVAQLLRPMTAQTAKTWNADRFDFKTRGAFKVRDALNLVNAITGSLPHASYQGFPDKIKKAARTIRSARNASENVEMTTVNLQLRRRAGPASVRREQPTPF